MAPTAVLKEPSSWTQQSLKFFLSRHICYDFRMLPEPIRLETRPRVVSFGPFHFDNQNRLLSKDGAEIPLPPRVLGVLELLLSRPGEIVPRRELLERVWKDAFVTDTSLAEAISFLRQALGDDPQAPRYIQTVHRRGYRFLSTPIPASSLSSSG